MNHFIEILYASSHSLNIYIHVSFGVVCMTSASAQLFNKKGGKRHRQLGHLFLKAYFIVITAAVLGIIIYEFRPFLAVLTLTSAYNCVAGYRIILLNGKRPKVFDNAISIIGLISVALFVFYIQSSVSNYSLVTIYATLVGVSIFCFYDLVRNFLPLSWLQRTWLKEHIVKIISAFSALLSAASGNLLPYGVYSQLLPSVFGIMLIIFFLLKEDFKPRNRHLN